MKRDRRPDLLAGLQPPPPPPGLRETTLRDARIALERPPMPDLWDRIWQNRGLRLAWVAGVTVLVAGHLLVSVHRQRSMDLPPSSSAWLLVHGGDGELANLIALPRLRLDARAVSAGWGTVPGAGARQPSPVGATPGPTG